MKFNPILFFIFLIFASALAWAGYEMCDSDNHSIAMALIVGGGLTIAGSCMSIDFGHSSGNVNGKAAAIVYMVLNILVNGIFSFFDFYIPALVITNLLLLVLLLIVIYLVNKVGNV